MTYSTLTPEEEKKLHRLVNFYLAEASACEKSKAYLAGCIMLGSALESLLILMCNIYIDDVLKSGCAPVYQKKFKPLLKWKLSELLNIAKACKWLPAQLKLCDAWNTKKATIGDYAEVAKKIRNLIHPACYLKEFCRKKITKKTFDFQNEIILLCIDWLAEWNKKSLINAINEELESS